MTAKAKKYVGINVTDEMYAQLQETAKASHRSMSGMIAFCLESFFSKKVLTPKAKA
jgi:hypothetical protein